MDNLSGLRIPPHSDVAEQAILSICLRYPDSIGDIEVSPEAFYSLENRRIWECIMDKHFHGATIDHVTVAESIQNIDIMKFMELNNSDHIRENIGQYAEIVTEAHKCRLEIDVLEYGISVAYEGESASSEVLGRLSAMCAEDDPDMRMDEYVDQFIDDCKEGKVGHFKWWCDEWTYKLGKMSSDLMILHAPRSTGKTAMMLQWIVDSHKNTGHRTPLASIEMLKKELAPRFLAHEGQVGTFAMRTRGHITSVEEAKSIDAKSRIRALELCVRDKDMTIDDICTWAIREKNGKGADAIFVDNLLSISDGGKRYDSKTIMYDSFIRRFRTLRDQLKIPIIILAHPNAEGNIAWSKDVENFADIILYLRDVPSEGVGFKSSGKTIYQRTDIEGKHILGILQKNRQGICPVVASLDFVGSTQTFKHLCWEDV